VFNVNSTTMFDKLSWSQKISMTSTNYLQIFSLRKRV
uniref:Uncharacterized protein n=1 Tax=Solanum lycopersicum TaxID=4081 RepID=A0A3Q7EWJ5_SOLLC